MENSSIEWTDHTFNPWIGCHKVSPGCKFCYAEVLMDTRMGKAKWGIGSDSTRVRTSPKNWQDPIRWNAKAKAAGRRDRVFCASLSDVFERHPDPTIDGMLSEWRSALFSIMESTEYLDWQVLTKRPENVMQMVPTQWLKQWPANVWIGTSVENQDAADERIPHLLRIPAPVRFLSMEPLLGPVDLFSAWMDGPRNFELGTINWVIVGGESGRNARPMDIDWARAIRTQCQYNGVPFFFKQWGEWVPSPQLGIMVRAGKHNSGNILDGKQYAEMPASAGVTGLPIV